MLLRQPLYNNRYDIEMSKQMGDCYGYPQLYLIDMQTRQVIWHACGWYKGFTKEIEEIINEKKLPLHYILYLAFKLRK